MSISRRPLQRRPSRSIQKLVQERLFCVLDEAHLSMRGVEPVLSSADAKEGHGVKPVI